ncbi:hypothetical protein ACU4GA_14520 [Methylobacterium oryzae CBMB20]
MPARQAVFTISRGVPFLPTLAEALLSGRLVRAGGGRSAGARRRHHLPPDPPRGPGARR